MTATDPEASTVEVEHWAPRPGAFGYVVRWQTRSHCVGFEAFEVLTLDAAGLRYFSLDDDEPQDFDRHVPEVRGHLKWDGCGGLIVGQVEDPPEVGVTYFHTCRGQDWASLVALLQHLYEGARQRLGPELDIDPWPGSPG